jgi:anti-anti-sigma factor
MELRERNAGSVTLIDLLGDGIGSEPSALKPLVQSVLNRGGRRIVLNLAELQAMDSTCVGEIFASYKVVVSLGGDLKLSNPDAQVRRLLHVTRVDTFLRVYDTEADAIASFEAVGSRTP